MSQRKVNVVRINFKSATELRLVRLEEYMCVSCQGAGTNPHLGDHHFFGRGVEQDL